MPKFLWWMPRPKPMNAFQMAQAMKEQAKAAEAKKECTGESCADCQCKEEPKPFEPHRPGETVVMSDRSYTVQPNGSFVRNPVVVE